MPETSGKPVVEAIRETEEYNYREVVAKLGDLAKLAELLSGLYDLVPRMYSAASLPLKDEYVAGLVFLMDCQCQLVLGTLAAERGHLTEAIQATRRAIESSALARRISLEPRLALIWLNAARSEEAYASYRRAFNPLFQKDDPLMSTLHERYEQSSRQMHASVYSLARRVRSGEIAGERVISYQYFEIGSDDKGEPVRTLLWIWDTHFGILRAFEEILAPVIESDRIAWDVRSNTFEAAMGHHKEQWRHLILPESEQSENHHGTNDR